MRRAIPLILRLLMNFFFFNDTATTEIYTLSLHDALPISGSTMPQPLYVLWGDEYHKLHPETQLRYLAVGTRESAKNVLSGAGDLGGGDAPIPEKQLKEAAYAAVELPTVLVGISVVYNLPRW